MGEEGRGEVKKTSKIDFHEETFPEIFRYGDFEPEVCWVTMIRGGWMKRGRYQKNIEDRFFEKTFLRCFDAGTSNVRLICSDYSEEGRGVS